MAPRIERHNDPAVLVHLVDGEGWTRAPGEVERRFRLEPAAHFVARDETGASLGNATTVVYHDAGEGRVAWLSGMIVPRDARSRGIGRALLHEALAYASAEKASRVYLDATRAGRPLYDSEGFAPLAMTARWQRDSRAPRSVPGASSSSIYPISSCEIMELHGYDAPRFGAGRSALLAQVIADFPERSFVAFDKLTGAITGFALGQERYVGPLVADSPDVAARLLYACERAGTPPLAHLVDANADAARVFADAGFAPDGAVCTRMVRGEPARLPGRPDTVYAIGAWALG